MACSYAFGELARDGEICTIFKNCSAMQSLTQIFQTVEGLSKIMLKERQCVFERRVLMERASSACFW